MTLEELYRLHCDGAMGRLDSRWDQVQDELRGIAVSVVRSVSSRRTGQELYGSPMDDRVEDVYTAILSKFIEKKLNARSSFTSVLMTAARNALLDAFRASSSPSATVGFDGADETWQDHERPVPKDLFMQVRQRLRSFRWAEFPHVRESLLAYFLTHHTFPGAAFLGHFEVEPHLRTSVYNAAVYDLNCALLEVVQA